MLFMHIKTAYDPAGLSFMDLTLMRSFLAVAEIGGVTGAAERIGITQPALSRRIQQLEEHLGVELLVRGRRGAVLTEIGRLVQSESQGIVARYEQMLEMVSSSTATGGRERSHRWRGHCGLLHPAGGHRRVSGRSSPGPVSNARGRQQRDCR